MNNIKYEFGIPIYFQGNSEKSLIFLSSNLNRNLI